MKRVSLGFVARRFLGVVISACIVVGSLCAETVAERAKVLADLVNGDKSSEFLRKVDEYVAAGASMAEVLNHLVDGKESVMHELADRAWGRPSNKGYADEIRAIDKAVALGGDLRKESGNGRGDPIKIADRQDFSPTEMYLRAKLMEKEGKASEYPDRDFFWSVHYGAPDATLKMIELIEKGVLDPALVNTPHEPRYGRTVVHEMAAEKWGKDDHKLKDSERKAMRKIFSLGGDPSKPQTQDTEYTPLKVAQAKSATYAADRIQEWKNLVDKKEQLLHTVVQGKDASNEEMAQQAINLLKTGNAAELLAATGDECGRTPFQHAVINSWYEKGGKHRQAVELMVEKGADTNKRDTCRTNTFPDGQRALDAVKKMNEETNVLPETLAYLKKLAGEEEEEEESTGEPPAETTWWKEFQMGMGGRGSSATPKIGGPGFFNVVYTLSRKKFPDSVSDHDRIKDTKKKSESELWELFDACIDDAKCDVNYAADWNYDNIPMNLIAQLNWPAQGGKWEEATKKILKRGADIDRKNSTGYSPMTEVGTTEATREFIRKNR